MVVGYKYGAPPERIARGWSLAINISLLRSECRGMSTGYLTLNLPDAFRLQITRYLVASL